TIDPRSAAAAAARRLEDPAARDKDAHSAGERHLRRRPFRRRRCPDRSDEKELEGYADSRHQPYCLAIDVTSNEEALVKFNFTLSGFCAHRGPPCISSRTCRISRIPEARASHSTVFRRRFLCKNP